MNVEKMAYHDDKDLCQDRQRCCSLCESDLITGNAVTSQHSATSISSISGTTLPDVCEVPRLLNISHTCDQKTQPIHRRPV